MRRVVLLALLALSLPTVALANTVDYSGGGTPTLSQSFKSGGFVDVTFSQLSINFGAFASGTVNIDPTLGASCGSGCFDITGGSITISNGSGTLFSGTFQSGTVSEVGGSVNIQGFLSNGTTVATVVKAGGTLTGSSETIVSTVPEPGTLGMLGTGLIGLAGLVRRKLRG